MDGRDAFDSGGEDEAPPAPVTAGEQSGLPMVQVGGLLVPVDASDDDDGRDDAGYEEDAEDGHGDAGESAAAPGVEPGPLLTDGLRLSLGKDRDGGNKVVEPVRARGRRATEQQQRHDLSGFESPSFIDGARERTALLAPRGGKAQAQPPSYGGIPVSFADGEIEQSGDDSYEYISNSQEGEEFSTSQDSRDENNWMVSRAGSLDQRREDSQRAAAIIGGGSAAVFFVVFAVVISGISALLSIDPGNAFSVRSDWPHHGTIPRQYGCHAVGGPDAAQSIPLSYSNVPEKTHSLVILVANPSALKNIGRDPVHWFVTEIPVNRGARVSIDVAHSSSGERWNIAANASRNPNTLLPKGAIQRSNSLHSSGMYYPPCTLSDGSPSFYIVYVYAVDAKPVISDFKDARQIMNRFTGVPTAKIGGHYRAADFELPDSSAKNTSKVSYVSI